MTEKPHLCWIGHIGGHTGLARVSDNLLRLLADRYRITVIAVSAPSPNYTVSWAKVIPAQRFQNWLGTMVLREVIQDDPPDVTVAFMDPWVLAEFVKGIPDDVPLIGYLPVDGYNMQAAPVLHRLTHAIFLSPFAVDEARRGGYTGPASVIGHGVDTSLYHPLNQHACREALGLPQDAILVGNVGQNQPRKRWDLTLRAFARVLDIWDVGQYGPLKLYCHCRARDIGWDIPQLADWLGIGAHVLLPTLPLAGYDESQMPLVYNSLDVQLSTTWGEGFGLTTLEGMACGIPQIVPDHTALHDWATWGAWLLKGEEMVVSTSGHNLVGFVPTIDDLVSALTVYLHNPALRASASAEAYAHAQQPQFRWETCAEQFHAILSAEVGAYATG